MKYDLKISNLGHQDSYVAAAGGSVSNSYGTPLQPGPAYGAPMMSYGMTGYGNTDTDEDGGGGIGGIGGGGSGGGLAGLLGLLGLKGLKGLKILKPLALLVPLLPALLPLLLPILLPLLLPIIPIILLALAIPLILLLFIPIPVVVAPGGRSNDIPTPLGTVALSSVAQVARDVLQSEECVERICCEVAKASKKFYFGALVDK
jgi:hypothetical protein